MFCNKVLMLALSLCIVPGVMFAKYMYILKFYLHVHALAHLYAPSKVELMHEGSGIRWSRYSMRRCLMLISFKIITSSTNSHIVLNFVLCQLLAEFKQRSVRDPPTVL